MCACGLVGFYSVIILLLTNSDYTKLCQIILCALGLVGFNSVIIKWDFTNSYNAKLFLWTCGLVGSCSVIIHILQTNITKNFVKILCGPVLLWAPTASFYYFDKTLWNYLCACGLVDWNSVIILFWQTLNIFQTQVTQKYCKNFLWTWGLVGSCSVIFILQTKIRHCEINCGLLGCNSVIIKWVSQYWYVFKKIASLFLWTCELVGCHSVNIYILQTQNILETAKLGAFNLIK